MDFFLGVFLITVLNRAFMEISRQERRIAELQNEVMAAKWLNTHGNSRSGDE